MMYNMEVTVAQLRQNLSKFLASGERITILKYNRPIAKLVPVGNGVQQLVKDVQHTDSDKKDVQQPKKVVQHNRYKTKMCEHGYLPEHCEICNPPKRPKKAPKKKGLDACGHGSHPRLCKFAPPGGVCKK